MEERRDEQGPVRRSVLEIMILMFTATVCFAILAIGFTIVWIGTHVPDANLSGITAALISIISAILGALLGLLAAKRDVFHPEDQ